MVDCNISKLAVANVARSKIRDRLDSQATKQMAGRHFGAGRFPTLSLHVSG